MANKFDTNPLDPEFPAKAKASAAGAANGAVYSAPPPRMPFSTSQFAGQPPSITEEETRELRHADFNTYAFQGAPVATYQTTNLADMNRASSRKVAKTGVPEKWLIGLPYLPFYIGLVAGLVQLLVIPKEETKVRFHAAQGLAAHVAIMLVSALLGGVGRFTDFARFGSLIFGLVTTVMLIVFAIKAWKGKPVHIEPVDDLTNWLEEKIGPVK